MADDRTRFTRLRAQRSSFGAEGLARWAVLGVAALAAPLHAEEPSLSIGQLLSAQTPEPSMALAVDLNSDGLPDVLTSAWDHQHSTHRVAWFKNTLGGSPIFGPMTVIDVWSTETVECVQAADLDNDGDQDVLVGTQGTGGAEGSIAWYENTNQGAFGPRQVVSNTVDNASTILAVDVNSDGLRDLVVVARDDALILWFENLGFGNGFSPAQTLRAGAVAINSLGWADVNGDGATDLLSASSTTGVSWYEHLDGMGTFGSAQAISPAVDAGCARAVDLDNDGDMDILAALTGLDKTVWYENTDGAGAFAAEQVISAATDGVIAVWATDVDSDGDMDVFASAAGDHALTWYRNTDGQGTFAFASQIEQSPGHQGIWIETADFDLDNDMDVLSAAGGVSVDSGFLRTGRITWYENSDGLGDYSTGHAISDDTFGGALRVVAGDIDGDGDEDVLIGSGSQSIPLLGQVETGRIAWCENLDGLGTYANLRLVATNADVPESLAIADLDGDGDADVLAGLKTDDAVAWFANLDGAGAFGPRQDVTLVAMSPSDVDAVDFDGDGDVDVLTAEADSGLVTWFKNTDGLGHFIPAQFVATGANMTDCARAADLDGDGDADVLCSWQSPNTIAWSANSDGAGDFGALQLIGTPSDPSHQARAGDLDGDGDLDVLSWSDTAIGWFENTDGAGTFGAHQAIEPTVLSDLKDARAADLDADGDLDVLITSCDDQGLAWFENTDAAGSFATRKLLGDVYQDCTNAAPLSIDVADVDMDGMLEVLTAENGPGTVVLHENDLVTPLLPDLGFALDGTHGPPLLVVLACLDPGTEITLTLTNALESTTATLVLGLAAIYAPFKGGTLVPNPDILIGGLPVDGAGGLVISGTWPGGIPPGSSFFMQHWIPDPAGPFGLAASNAVSGTTP